MAEMICFLIIFWRLRRASIRSSKLTFFKAKKSRRGACQTLLIDYCAYAL